MRVLLGLGSNLGDRRTLLRDAVRSLEELGPLRVSSLYETDPVGGPGGQGAYLNLVAELDCELSPRELLGVCHRLETAADRVRAERWGPRTLDVDIIWIEGVTVDEPDLIVPHPRFRERRFVMAPLAELAPDLLEEGWQARAEGHVEQVGEL